MLKKIFSYLLENITVKIILFKDTKRSFASMNSYIFSMIHAINQNMKVNCPLGGAISILTS